MSPVLKLNISEQWPPVFKMWWIPGGDGRELVVFKGEVTPGQLICQPEWRLVANSRPKLPMECYQLPIKTVGPRMFPGSESLRREGVPSTVGCSSVWEKKSQGRICLWFLSRRSSSVMGLVAGEWDQVHGKPLAWQTVVVNSTLEIGGTRLQTMKRQGRADYSVQTVFTSMLKHGIVLNCNWNHPVFAKVGWSLGKL